MTCVTFGGLRNQTNWRYTWRLRTPLIERRLDCFLVSNHLQHFIKKAIILNAISTDHPSHWRLNNSLLENETYVTSIKNNKMEI